MREQITDGEIQDASAFATKASMYHCMPGIVVAYHAAVAGQSQPSVDVQPGTNDVRFDTDTGARIPEPWPTILGVPLAMAKGGGASIAFAMGKGDHVTLVAYDLDPSKHRGTGNAEDPVDTRRHGGGHWIALPFDITDAGAVADPGGDLVVTPPTGGVVVVGPGDLVLQNGANKAFFNRGSEPVHMGAVMVAALQSGPTPPLDHYHGPPEGLRYADGTG